MNESIRKKFHDESHERAVRQAMFDATDDLIRRRKEREADGGTRSTATPRSIEERFEQLEKRLERLELSKK